MDDKPNWIKTALGAATPNVICAALGAFLFAGSPFTAAAGAAIGAACGSALYAFAKGALSK